MRHLLFAFAALLIQPAVAVELTGCGEMYASYPPKDAPLDVTGPEIIGRGPLLLAGIEEPIDGRVADMQIDVLWTRFEQRNQWIVNAQSDARTGVCFNAGADSSFDYFAGQVLSSPAADLPETFSTLELPASRYAVFVLTGSADEVAGAQTLIHRTLLGEAGLVAANAPDLLVFPPGFSPARRDARIELWVPLGP